MNNIFNYQFLYNFFVFSLENILYYNEFIETKFERKYNEFII